MRALLLLVVFAAPAAAQPRAAGAAPHRAGATGEAAGGLAFRLPGPERARPDPPTPTRPSDAWLGPDKALHAGVSFLLTLSAQYALTDKAGFSDSRARPASAGFALGIGLGKEVLDSRRAAAPEFSLRDLAADAVGVALGVLVTAF